MAAALIVVMIASQTPYAVFVSGQSLSYGASTGSALSTSQTLGNVGPTQSVDGSNQVQFSSTTAWPLVSLVEGSSMESPRSGLANYYATATGTPLQVFGVGKGGTAWSGLEPGTTAWDWSIYGAESFGARSRGTILGLYVVHGEADHRDGVTRVEYETYLVEWQAAFEALSTRVGAGQSVPLYLDQVSSWEMLPVGAGDPTATVVLGQYDAARDYPGEIVLVGPKYQYDYRPDGIHLEPASSRAMGALAGNAIAYGPTWQPLWPSLTSPITRNGAVITIPMHVPSPPMVFDTTSVTNPGNYGFTYTDDGTPPAISSVAIDGSNIVVTLASTPSGANKRIRYALTTTSNTSAGYNSGPRGNVRDSASETWAGSPLYNWLVHFEEAVP